MAVTLKMYGPSMQNIMTGLIADLSHGDTSIRVALMDNAFTFNQAHSQWSDVSARQISSVTYPDYTNYGVVIANKQVNYATRVSTFKTTDAKNIQTASGDITASFAVIYRYVDDTGVPHATNSKLIACVDFDGEQISAAGEFSLEWHVDGIFAATVAA